MNISPIAPANDKNRSQRGLFLCSVKNEIILISFLLLGLHLNAQEINLVHKSEEIRVINGKSYYVHIIKNGHTAYSISKAYNISVDKLFNENPEAKNGLKIGQSLIIPYTPKRVIDSDKKLIEHIVKRSETLYGISRKYEISIDDIYLYNPKSKEGLLIGQILKIPVDDKWILENITASPRKIIETSSNNIVGKGTTRTDTTQKEIIEHVVRFKETLYSISRKYDVSIDEICYENPGSRERLLEGQMLRIPVDKYKIREKEESSRKITKKKDTDVQKMLIEHVVGRKETLYSLSIKYDISIDEIRKYNPGLKGKIKKGSILYIPNFKKQTLDEKISTEEPKTEEVFHGDYGIFLVKKSKIELVPGSTSNMVVKLINNTDSIKEFHLKIKTPTGWSQLTDYASVIVERHSKRIKIFSFHIHEKTNVGDYTVNIEAYNKEKNKSIGSVNIPVYVQARYEMMIQLMEAPEYLFAGDILSVKFMIQNLSNVEAHIHASLINVNIPEIRTFTLAPDSMVITTVLVKATDNIEHYTRNSLSMTASIIESPEIKNEISYIFNVMPSDKVKFDAFNRIPVKISGLLVTDNQMGDRKYGGMFDIKGNGLISKRKNRMIDFHFRGPDQQGNPILGLTDEYYVKYSSLHSNATVGDNTFRLTELTEGARYGRGIEYEHKLKKMSMGAFVNYPRFYPNVKRVYSVFGSYFSGTKYRINAAYMNKLFVTDSSAQLYTLSGETNPFSWGNLKLEYATGMEAGKMTKAYSLGFKVHLSRYRFFFNYMKADKDFPGYITNSMYLSSGLSASILKRLNISINYNISHYNIALDTMFSNAPYTDNLSLSLAYNINFNHGISIGLNKRGSEDRRLPKQFDYDEYTARLTLQSRMNRLRISVYGAYGKTQNYLVQNEYQITNVFNSNLTINYTIHKNVFIKAFVSYLGGQQYLSDDYTRFYYGATANAHWNDKVLVVFQYQNNYEVEEYYRDRSLFALDANYIVNRNHEFGVGVNYNLRKNYLNNTQLSASLKYTYTLNLPVSRREDVGSLRGKVINNGVEKVEGIIFTLEGNISVTDENGEFEFPYVKTGTHFLFVDYSEAGLNTIAEEPGPYRIELMPGQEYNFELRLTKSGKISGKILISEDENMGKKGYIPIKEEVKNLIVEANNGSEIYRMFTNKYGAFDFEDLRPGQWNVKVYDRGIPKGFQLINDEFHIELKPEQIKHIDIVIKKKSRKIKFQKKL